MVIGAFRPGLVVEAKPFLEGSPTTDDMMNLPALAEKSADADLLREMTPDQVRGLCRREADGDGGGCCNRRRPG